MNSNNLYESREMHCILGDTLRPGGFKLTDEAVNFCELSKGNEVLDIGCGMGSTVEYLENMYFLKSFGIDPSKILITNGKNKNPNLRVQEGRGENIPFEDKCMDAVFAECTLSLMEDLEKTIEESFRVLKNKGSFVITDVYARNPEYIHLMDKFDFNSCMRGLHDIEKLKIQLKNNGFKIVLFKDYTDLLKELTVKIIFKYGSMNIFWSKAASCSKDCFEFQKVLSRCKVGYFLMIAKKEDNIYE